MITNIKFTSVKNTSCNKKHFTESPQKITRVTDLHFSLSSQLHLSSHLSLFSSFSSLLYISSLSFFSLLSSLSPSLSLSPFLSLSLCLSLVINLSAHLSLSFSLLFHISSLFLFSKTVTVCDHSLCPECQRAWILALSLLGEKFARYYCLSIPAYNACHLT